MAYNYRNRSHIANNSPELAEALDDLAAKIHSIMEQTNSSHTGQTNPPPDINGLTVNAKDGIFDVAISDNHSEVKRGINYFLEYSQDKNFKSPTVVDIGTSRNWRGHLGNQQLYWRGYSSYPTSPRSNPVPHPFPIMGGGTTTGPVLSPSSGSGTTKGATGSDGGFGNFARRNPRGLS